MIHDDRSDESCKENAESQEGENIESILTTDVELNELKAELEEFKDKYFRQLAETENLRKRLLKERDELIQHAIRNVIVDFLHPIDNLENALGFTEQSSEEIKHWAHGFKMILTQFKDVLSDNGVRSFESEGHSFDPHFHEAVDTVVTDEKAPGTVVEEVLRGYKMGEKMLRPARVTVAKAQTEKNN